MHGNIRYVLLYSLKQPRLTLPLDNVVRAGLTPKLRDVPTLVSMLTYTSAPAHAQLLQPSSFAPHTQLYDPPIDEFSVLRLALAPSESATHRPIEGPSLCIVTDGEGTFRVKDGSDSVDVKRGNVVFIAAETEVEFVAAGGDGLEVYRAYVEA